MAHFLGWASSQGQSLKFRRGVNKDLTKTSQTRKPSGLDNAEKKDARPANRHEADHRAFTSYARALPKRPTRELFHSPAQGLANVFSRGSQSKYRGHTVSAATSPVCGCSVNAAPDPLCPIKLFTKVVAIPLTQRGVPVVDLLFLLGPRLGEADVNLQTDTL